MLHPDDLITEPEKEGGENLHLNPEEVTFEDLDLDLVVDAQDKEKETPEAETKPDPESKDDEKEKEGEKPTEEAEKEGEPSEKEKKAEEKEKEPEEKPDPEEAGDPEDDDEAPVIAQILDSFGLEADGENTYEDTAEGLIELTQDLVDNLFNERISAFFQENEETARYHQFIAAGNDPRDYFKQRYSNQDFSKMEVTDTDVTTQKSLVRSFYRAQGIPDDAIQSQIDALEAGGTLKSTAEVAKTALVAAQEKQNQRFKDEQDRLAKDEKDRADALFATVSETISKQTEFAGVAIPKKDLQGLPEYMLTKVKNGMTQSDIDIANLNVEQHIVLRWLVRGGFKLDAVVNALASKKSTRSLKSRLSKEKAKNTKGGDRRKKGEQQQSSDDKKIDVDNLALDLTNLV